MDGLAIAMQRKLLSSRGSPNISHRQSGAALIIALVMLAIVTIIGVANMNSSGLEMKMIASTLDRNKAFSIADAGLRAAETWLEKTSGLAEEDLYTDTCGSRTLCFSPTCTNGLCFQGIYEENVIPNRRRYGCEVVPSGVSRRVFWRDSGLNVWNNAAQHRTVQIGPVDIERADGSVVQETYSVKYIVEFLCFVSKGTPPNGGKATPFDATKDNNNNADVLFRITVFFDGDDRRVPVMLQSNYVFPLS